MADFNLAIPTVLENEGGYINDPKDPGGETKYGISKRSYPNLDIKNLTVEEATAIYLRDFWLFGGITSQPVATKLLDSYVNLKHTAIKFAQDVVGAVVDGKYGPNTERAINNEDPVTFLTRFRNELVDHYLDKADPNSPNYSPVDAEDLKGLLLRARQ